jgi:chemotaxis protein MotB
MLRIQGLAFSQPFNRQEPTHPSNRRISIIVMNREAEDRVFKTLPEIQSEAPPTPDLPSSPVPTGR